MRLTNSILALSLLLTAACTQQPEQNERLTDYVNPLIGSGGHGHVFVGASVPFGMVQLGPMINNLPLILLPNSLIMRMLIRIFAMRHSIAEEKFTYKIINSD